MHIWVYAVHVSSVCLPVELSVFIHMWTFGGLVKSPHLCMQAIEDCVGVYLPPCADMTCVYTLMMYPITVWSKYCRQQYVMKTHKWPLYTVDVHMRYWLDLQ